jgi:hypothetical protein
MNCLGISSLLAWDSEITRAALRLYEAQAKQLLYAMVRLLAARWLGGKACGKPGQECDLAQ